MDGTPSHPKSSKLPAQKSKTSSSHVSAKDSSQPSGEKSKELLQAQQEDDYFDIVQKLWGNGFISPGDLDFLVPMVKPLGLDPSMSILNLSPEIGTLSRYLVDQYAVWVDGYENSEIIARRGARLSRDLGYKRHAPIEYMNFESLKFEKLYDCIFVKERFFIIMDKVTLFDVLENCLKPKGQLLFIDYLLDSQKGCNQAVIDSWQIKEPFPPTLQDVHELRQELIQRNFDVRVSQDITDIYMKMIEKGLGKLILELKKGDFEAGYKKLLLKEVQLWTNRYNALKNGLKVYKFYVIKQL